MSKPLTELTQVQIRHKRVMDRKHKQASLERKEQQELEKAERQRERDITIKRIMAKGCSEEDAIERVEAHHWINAMADLAMTLYNFFRGWDEPTTTPKHLEMLDELVSELAKVPEMYIDDPVLKENLWTRSVRHYGNLGFYFPAPADSKIYFETELRRYRGENIPRYVPPTKPA